MGSSTVDILGLGVPFLKLSLAAELKLGVVSFPRTVSFPAEEVF